MCLYVLDKKSKLMTDKLSKQFARWNVKFQNMLLDERLANMPDKMQRYTTDKARNKVSEYMPDRMSKYMSDNMPDQKSEYDQMKSQRRCQIACQVEC
jgi:hypothetical protein